VSGARGSEAQRAEAAARHQGRSTPGGGEIWVKYRGFIQFFHDSGGLSGDFHDTGGYQGILGYIWGYLGMSGDIYLGISGISGDIWE